MNGTGINLFGDANSDIVINNNYAYVNSSAASGGLNKSANITLYNLPTNFANPVIRKKYATFDLKVTKEINNFTIAFEGVNIFNQSYEELKDVDGTGRWYKLSCSYSF